MLKGIRLICLLLAITTSVMNAQTNISINRIEPANWWVGMKTNQLQLLVHGKNIAQATVRIESTNIKLIGIEKTENVNYLFVNIEISENAIAGSVPITFSANGKDTTIQYPLLARRIENKGKGGFDASDAIYLITPDRFSKGDPTLGNIKGYADTVNRKDPNGRHGGDIKGISDHIDYIKQLGFTAIWINPLLENNMPATSYHGYAITDYYKIDPRFGSNDDYYKLVDNCHANDMKVIMDFVVNHCGLYYWWKDDLPSADWYHQFDNYTSSNYRSSSLVDPYASNFDKKIFEYGWFDKTMPDLNQKNKFLAKYLTQNTLWWIETANLDGIRLDTQPYSDMQFLLDWVKAINNEYPDFTIVGESWISQEAFTACFQKNDKPISNYRSSMHSVTDFPLCFAINAAVNEKEGWDQGMVKVYNVLAQDFLYGNAFNNVIFLTNHDLSRVYEGIKGDIKKYKIMLNMLATLRGIPQFYYADEILMPGDKGKGDGTIRRDMPGGWPSDSANIFTGKNLKPSQVEALDYTRKLFSWRKNSTTIARGTLTHFVPSNGLYVYARIHTASTVLVVINNNEKDSVMLDNARYAEVINKYTKASDVLTGKEYELKNLSVSAKTSLILELKP